MIDLDRQSYHDGDAASGRRHRFVGLSTETKPTTSATDTPLADGCEFYEQDTGRAYYFDGGSWWIKQPATLQDAVSVLSQILDAQTELLLETKAIRAGVELDLFRKYDLNIDLRTEEINQLQEN